MFCSSDLEAEEDVKAQRETGFGSDLGCFMSLRQRCRKGREGLCAEVAGNVGGESTTGTHQGPRLGDHVDVIQDCAAPGDLGS